MKISEYIGLIGDLLLSRTFERFKHELDLAGEDIRRRLHEFELDLFHEVSRDHRKNYSTVLLLHPDRNEVMSRTIALEPGEEQQVRFFPRRGIPKGTWAVILGPASMNGLFVGNMAQSSCSLEEGPAGLTVDEHHLGSSITVGVKGWN